MAWYLVKVHDENNKRELWSNTFASDHEVSDFSTGMLIIDEGIQNEIIGLYFEIMEIVFIYWRHN